MKKSILILIASFIGLASFSQTGKIGTVPIYSGEKTFTGSKIKQTNGTVRSTAPIGVGTLTPYGSYSLTVKGSTGLLGASTGTATSILNLMSSDSVQKFKVRDDGAIFTGTYQAVSSSTFVAGSNTITVRNGLITNIE